MALFPVAACLLSLTCLAPAPPPASTLQLTSHDNAGRIGSVVLTCEPAGGTHPKRERACAVLEGVNGDFARITARHQACTLIYAPVEVTAVGTWRGRPASYRTTYGNRCEADRDSDGVFGF
ncbi:SSI family serine proteinase inhibitor [Amycolatopsis sp., V23-08]|uniref:SSI family serine proteinase inhibitor n=1 Tax=Amycolatopsis heterodermiae TaxID=3110235 RepID=A0ABU5RJW4_9PSEU|nr:SSI family serine proteinase inhibitor [Amycolatopsis sp., V23-08]MEA5366568.1 SSI family serine proteinase inhibitor [Amycolatopsis sp., V23-08]